MSQETTTLTHVLPEDNGQQIAGTVCAANESRFNASHYSEALTTFTVGWRDTSAIEALLGFIAPMVPVSRRFEFKKGMPGEAFLSEADDVRAIGAPFKRVEFTGSSVYGKTLNKGLTVRVDHDDTVGDDWQERHVQMLLQRLYRNELRRSVAALDSHDSEIKASWGSNGNPDADIRNALLAAADETGIYPNRILFGEGAWFLRSDAYDGQDNARASRSAGLTPQELAEKLFVDEVRILNARYQSGENAKTRILGNEIYLFYGREGALKDEPSNLKRFVTPTEGGSPFRVYLEEHAKFTDITVEHYSNLMVTSPAGIKKLTVSA